MLVNKADGPADNVDNPSPDDSVETDDNAVTADDNPVVEDPESTDPSPPELPHEWMKGLTTEQKADAKLIEALSKFPKGIPDVSKAYVELQSKVGKPVVPGNDATEEELNAYREAVGIPKSAEDYTLNDVQLPEDTEVATEMEAEVLQLLHGLNVSQAQLDGLRAIYLPILDASRRDAQKIVKDTEEQALEKMKNRMSPDEFKQGQTFMARAFNKFASPEVAEKFDISGLGNDQGVIDMFIAMGKAIGEALFVDAEATGRADNTSFGKRSNAELGNALYGKTG